MDFEGDTTRFCAFIIEVAILYICNYALSLAYIIRESAAWANPDDDDFIWGSVRTENDTKSLEISRTLYFCKYSLIR